ncbi:MAG: hypothetical protein HC890_18000 [Chloroflexaceae bacterium]|nr:hypothetical protein [Chloroflexaceae bacterium]
MTNSSDQTISPGGDFKITATNAVVNLRDISGSVTNAINQLPGDAAPNQPDLKTALQQLQEAIQTDPELADPNKAKALKQLQTLAEAAQNPTSEESQNRADYARFNLEKLTQGLAATTQFVQQFQQFLPVLKACFGLS